MVRLGYLLVAALFVALLPTVQGHSAVEVLDNEVHLLHDASDDSYALFDGYDVVDVWAREAWLEGHGEGLILRFSVYGGFQPLLRQAESLELTLNVTGGGESHEFDLRTTDGANWTGNLTLLETTVGSGILGSTVVLQVFVSQEQLGVTRGDVLTGFRLASSADGEPLDVAPGGRFFAGAELPEESETVTPALTLRGPFGYTSTTASLQGDQVDLQVTNLITVQGQHIILDAPPVAGWTFEADEAGYSVEANQSVAFQTSARATPGSPDLLLYVTSDLGGRELVTLKAPPAPPTPPMTPPAPQPPTQVEVERPVEPEPDEPAPPGSPAPTPEPEEPEGEDTPGLGLLAIGLLLVLAAAYRRR